MLKEAELSEGQIGNCAIAATTHCTGRCRYPPGWHLESDLFSKAHVCLAAVNLAQVIDAGVLVGRMIRACAKLGIAMAANKPMMVRRQSRFPTNVNPDLRYLSRFHNWLLPFCFYAV